MPERASGLCVEGKCVVGGGGEHNSVHDNRGNFEGAGIRRVEDPLGAKLRDIGSIDFAKSAVAAAGVVAIVGEPIIGDGLREQTGRVYIEAGDHGSYPCTLSGQHQSVPGEERNARGELLPSSH